MNTDKSIFRQVCINMYLYKGLLPLGNIKKKFVFQILYCLSMEIMKIKFKLVF